MVHGVAVLVVKVRRVVDVVVVSGSVAVVVLVGGVKVENVKVVGNLYAPPHNAYILVPGAGGVAAGGRHLEAGGGTGVGPGVGAGGCAR